jgi:hypothetical protein
LKHRLTLAALQAGKLSPDISVNRLKPCYFANSKIDGVSHSQATTSYLVSHSSLSTALSAVLCTGMSVTNLSKMRGISVVAWAKCGFFQVASLQHHPALTQLVRHASRYIKYVTSMNIPNSYHPASPSIVLKFPRHGSQLNLMEHPPGVVCK